MRSLFFLGALFGLALLLQVTLAGMISLWGAVPDLVLLPVVFHGLWRGSREGALWGFAAGLGKDFLCGHYLGLSALSLSAAGYLAGWAESRLYKESTAVALLTTLGCSLASQLIYYPLLFFVGVKVPLVTAVVRVILPTAVYSAALVPLFYPLFSRLYQRGWMGSG
ncbi:rod shape-determining protein MreD [Desulfovirgula thermocuniculi]|uniref:rod shape-determining protein MreD n=1 Tax=Desulfovirgula thermocuniculi TaxID=348842 RepID=UPI0004876562|nr:rod shape-determining protein MreD [Desulfovirgula thermocuniculi]